jgi:hypothetical protein
MAGALQSFNSALSVAMTWIFVAASDSWAQCLREVKQLTPS